MQSRISTPVGVSILVVALLLVGFVAWRSLAPPSSGPVTGIPRDSLSTEAQAGYDALKSIPRPGATTGQ